MSLTVGPLFSLDASGKFAKFLTYGKNKSGNWVRAPIHHINYATPAQKTTRDWFGIAKATYSLMSQEERQLWYMAVREDYTTSGRDYYRFKRSGLCLAMHEIMGTRAFTWGGCPFPPLVPRLDAVGSMTHWSDGIADIADYTVLAFCTTPGAWFYQTLPLIVSKLHPDYDGQCNQIPSGRGHGVAILQSYYNSLNATQKYKFELMQLVFLLLSQHGYWYSIYMTSAWQIADEISDDIIAGGWVPPYKYNGQSLPNLVGHPLCDLDM